MRLRSDRCCRQSSSQPSIASVRDIKESLQEIEVGASHPCEATCEQADDSGEATIQFHS